MRIAIIGAGSAGSALGTRWAADGHAITFAVRRPQEEEGQKLVASLKGKAQAAAIRDGVAQADVVVLATPWEAAKA